MFALVNMTMWHYLKIVLMIFGRRKILEIFRELF
jgi:hypothetical protein